MFIRAIVLASIAYDFYVKRKIYKEHQQAMEEIKKINDPQQRALALFRKSEEFNL